MKKLNRREDIQEEIIKAILKNKFEGIVDVSPRVGKSRCVIESIKRYKPLNICIITPSLPVIESWEMEFSRWGLSNKPDIYTFRSIKKIPKGTDILIIDEVHQLSDANYNSLKKLNKTHILGLSGTISPETLYKIQDLLNLKVIYKYSFSQAIKDNIISNFEIYTIPIKLNDSSKIIGGTKKFPKYTTEKKQYEYLTRQFDKFKEESNFDYSKKKLKDYFSRLRQFFIYESETKLLHASDLIRRLDTCLAFTGSTKGADYICDYSHHSKSLETNYLSDFISGKIKKLSVVSMVNVGVTFSELKTIVIHQLQSNSEAAIQRILRACNLDDKNNIAKIYIFYYKDTKDEEWMNLGLREIDNKHIKNIEYEELIKII